MEKNPTPARKALARRRPISLPQTLSDKADQRQTELGYSKFSQYVAYLIAKDSDRPDLTPAAHAPVTEKLQKAKKTPRKRKIGILRDLDWVSLSVFETSAGHPLSPNDSPAGELRAPSRFDLPGAFILRVNGDSMNAAALPARLGGGSILPGDHVVMQWSEHREANSGDIVAAQILGNGSTLKRLVQRGGRQWLQPESRNDKHERIALSGDGEPLARVQAVMIGKLPGVIA